MRSTDQSTTPNNAKAHIPHWVARVASARPTVTGGMLPMLEIGCSTLCSNDPTCPSRPDDGESAVARYPRSMSAMDMPISLHAPAFRIIGATTSTALSRACTGPTVVASSPVANHAFDITPCLTHRWSMTSWRRVRSMPRYRPSRCSAPRPSTTAFRSGSRSHVSANSRTSSGSACQWRYSGGS